MTVLENVTVNNVDVDSRYLKVMVPDDATTTAWKEMELLGGQQLSIGVDERMVLVDGLGSYELCIKHDVEPIVIQYTFTDDMSKMRWIAGSIQRVRNFTPQQRDISVYWAVRFQSGSTIERKIDSLSRRVYKNSITSALRKRIGRQYEFGAAVHSKTLISEIRNFIRDGASATTEEVFMLARHTSDEQELILEHKLSTKMPWPVCQRLVMKPNEVPNLKLIQRLMEQFKVASGPLLRTLSQIERDNPNSQILTYFKKTPFISHLKTIVRETKSLKPLGACSKCNGKGCSDCLNSGFLVSEYE